MKKILTSIILTATLALAGPAFRGSQTFSNADNSTFQGTLQGDPWFSCIKDDVGNIIVQNTTNNTYEYANFDATGSTPVLKASGIQAGTLTALRATNPTNAQLTNVWSAAKAAISAQTLQGTLSGSIWYQVRDYGNNEKTLYMVSVNSAVSTLTFQRIESGQISATKKDNTVHIDGQKLVNDSVMHLYYSVFSPQTGYLEVKVYQDQAVGNSAVLSYTDRWYSNQIDATTYYNIL